MKTTAATPNSAPPDQQKGFLLYNRRSELSENIVESLPEIEQITGINQGELRIRLKGQGVGVLNVNRPLNKLEDCAKDLQSVGLGAAVVARTFIKKHKLPPRAKHLNLSGSGIRFMDGDKNVLFEINRDTDLLIILTDLSGKAVSQMMTTMAYTGNIISRNFEEILKKLSIAKPAAIFYSLSDPSGQGVYVDSEIFSYMGLNDKMTPSKGSNFRVMITEAMNIARSCVTDENFGITLLPGSNPEWSKDKSAVELELGRYSGYICVAVKKKLLPFKEDANHRVADKSVGSQHSSRISGAAPDTVSDSTTGLLPPPDMNYSKITTFFQTSLPELIIVLIVLIAPFSSLMAGVKGITNHPVFWKAFIGSGMVIGGVAMFCYSLVLLYYRRMVENTPTSRIRSLSMGMVELAGKAAMYYDLRTSATQTRCIYYHCRHYRLKKTNDGSYWSRTSSVSSGKIAFYIEDETGRVLIKPRGALFNIPLTTQSFEGSYIPTLGIQLPDSNTKVVEEMVPVGAKLYVLGSARIEKHGKKTREIIIDKLRLMKQNPKLMSEYDVNGDGKIDVDEWEAARNDVEQLVYAESLANGPGESESVVIGKPRLGFLPFIIADSEKSLIRRLMLRIWFFLAGGLIIMGFGVNILITFFS